MNSRLLHAKAVVAEQRADVDLDHGTGLELAAQQLETAVLEESRGAFGMCDQQTVAAALQCVADADEALVDSGERGLQQQPAAAPRTSALTKASLPGNN